MTGVRAFRTNVIVVLRLALIGIAVFMLGGGNYGLTRP